MIINFSWSVGLLFQFCCIILYLKCLSKCYFDHVIFLKVVLIVNVFMYWRWHSILEFGEHDGNVKIFFCFYVNIPYIISFIDDFYLRLEAILKLYAHHECDTLSNGNIFRKRMNHHSHSAENMNLCNRGGGDNTGVEFLRIDSGRSFSHSHTITFNWFCTSK